MYNRLRTTWKWEVIYLGLLFEVVPRYVSEDINTNSISVTKVTVGKTNRRLIITTLPGIDCGPGYYLDDLYDCQPCSPGTMDIPDCHAVDPCRLDPCKNGGTCDNVYTDMGLDLVNFMCHCPLPYTGPTCEVVDSCKPGENSGNYITNKNKSGLGFSSDYSTSMYTNDIYGKFRLLSPVILTVFIIFIVLPAIYTLKRKRNSSKNNFRENPESSTGSDGQPIDPINCQQDLESDILESKLQQPQYSTNIQQHQYLPDPLSPSVSNHQLIYAIYNTPELPALLASNLQGSASAKHQNMYQSETVQPGFDTPGSRSSFAEEMGVNDPISVDFDGFEDPSKPLLYE